MKKTDLLSPLELAKMIDHAKKSDSYSDMELLDYIDKLHNRIRNLELQLTNFHYTVEKLFE